NRAVGAVVVRGRPQVLLADRDRSHAQSLAGGLRSQNMDVTVVGAARVPRARPSAPAGRSRSEPGAVAGRRAPLAEHGRDCRRAAADSHGPGGPTEVRRARALKRLVAQADPAADGLYPRLRP